MGYDGSALLQRTAQTRYRDGVDLRTLTGDETFNKRTANFLGLDPGGADRTLALIVEKRANGLFQFVENTGTADNLILQDDTPATVVTLGPGDSAVLRCDGISWAATTTRPNGAAIADPGDGNAIPVTESGSCAMTSVGVETRTVAAPTFLGQVLDLSFDVDGGNIAVTYSAAFNQAANTVATFSDAGEHFRTVAVQVASALVWRVIANDGAVLS